MSLSLHNEPRAQGWLVVIMTVGLLGGLTSRFLNLNIGVQYLGSETAVLQSRLLSILSS